MATPAEQDLLASRILTPVAQGAARLPPTRVSGFLAMRGNAYNNGLMVVGRATNGWETEHWDHGILPGELVGREQEYATDVFARSSAAGRCPMLWVSDLWGKTKKGVCNTARSAFWRVIRTVMSHLALADTSEPSWPSYLVWSNLYKVAPTAGWNPSGRLCKLQLSGCVELQKLERETYTPSRILYLTGLNWAAEFLPPLVAGAPRRARGRYVGDSGKIGIGGESADYVVAAHPQGKREAQWVDEVIASFQELSSAAGAPG